MDSTVFLQSLASSCPTIGVWKKTTTVHRQNSKKDYQDLLKKNVIFNDFEKAAKFINKNYFNIEKWLKKFRKIKQYKISKISIVTKKLVLKI